MSIPDVLRLKQEEHVHNEKSVLKEVSHPFLIKLVFTGPDRKPGDRCRPAERRLGDTGSVSSSTRVPASGTVRLPAPPRGREDGKGHRLGSTRDVEAAGTAGGGCARPGVLRGFVAM
ncbi:Serine/threonine-protein kinase PRKX [Fukomys damarensis]|uniref:Serine/threonine-protein kinase PRKX n=1 Tax=Fukomys damarensis TaxID=885580 RepID=A0A091CX23_FUKDA|nr:Serine/threonine-protein kinase PRKX [Fukomys damarensis]